MKLKLLFVVLIFGLNQLWAQTAKKPPVYKQPDGFIFIPNKANNTDNTSFFVMKEPVSLVDFKNFIGFLYSQNRIVEANVCNIALPKTIGEDARFVVLLNPDPISLYAKYLSEKYSNKDFTVSCSLVSEKKWKQMEGAAPDNLINYKNKFGLSFYDSLCEWKLNQQGKANKVDNKYNNNSAAFRLVLTVSPIKPKQ